jgi:hypothetical protein
MPKPILGWAFEIAFWICMSIAIAMLFGAMFIMLSGIMTIWLGA